MPIPTTEYLIPDLDPLNSGADLATRFLEVSDAAGNSNKVDFATFAQTVNNNAAGGNNSKSLYKTARTYDTTDPSYVPGFPTLVGLNPDFLASGALCWVEFPGPSREYRLMYNPNGTVIGYTSGEFTGQKLTHSWVEKTEADQLIAGFADFNPFTPEYDKGDSVKFTLNGVIRLFSARQTLTKSSFSTNRIPEPTGSATDANWAEISAQPSPNDSIGGQIACRFRTIAESLADPYGGDSLEAVTQRNPYLYTYRTATVELGPNAGTYHVVYAPGAAREFDGYVDGSFTGGKNPCKWELLPAISGGGVVNLTGVTENVGGFHVGDNFQGDLQAFAEKLLIAYQVPAFTSFGFDDGGSRPILAGYRFSGQLRIFDWSTSNSANVATNSITITDATLGTTLLAGTENDGGQGIVVPDFTLESGQTKTFTIAGQNTNGGSFSTSLTLTGVLARFYGASTLTPSDLKAHLQNGNPINLGALGFYWDLKASIANDITADCSGGKYVYYLYEASLPNPSVVRAGLNSFSAYTVATVQLTDQNGSPRSYKLLYTGIQFGSAVNFNVVS